MEELICVDQVRMVEECEISKENCNLQGLFGEWRKLEYESDSSGIRENGQEQ